MISGALRFSSATIELTLSRSVVKMITRPPVLLPCSAAPPSAAACLWIHMNSWSRRRWHQKCHALGEREAKGRLQLHLWAVLTHGGSVCVPAGDAARMQGGEVVHEDLLQLLHLGVHRPALQHALQPLRKLQITTKLAVQAMNFEIYSVRKANRLEHKF